MTTNTLFNAGVVVAVLLSIAGLFFPKPINNRAIPAGASAGNSATQKIAEWSLNPTVGTATTSSSLVNSDGQDRIIVSIDVYCSNVGSSNTAYSGGGLNSLLFNVATTSTSAPVSLGLNTNYLLSSNIATSSPEAYNASTTVVSVFNRRWAVGSYLTVSSNATNTAACIINARYLQGLGV